MAVSFPATASFPVVASFPSGSVYPASASYPAGGAPAPFDPATITDLALFLQYDAAHCTSNTAGQPVSSVTASYGTTRTASQTLTLRPTFQMDGLSYDGAATQYLNISSAIVLNGAFTFYSVFNTAGPDCFNLGSVLGQALFGFLGGVYTVFNDVGTSGGVGSATGLVLARISWDGGAAISMKFTGGESNAPSVPGPFTLDCLGATPGNGGFSGDTANRSLLDILKTSDNSGTVEDTNILSWIQTNYGASLT